LKNGPVADSGIYPRQTGVLEDHGAGVGPGDLPEVGGDGQGAREEAVPNREDEVVLPFLERTEQDLGGGLGQRILAGGVPGIPD
jgi:hypothetical protein